MGENTRLTTIYLNSDLHDSFKNVDEKYKVSFSDFVGYCLYKYKTEEAFQKEVYEFIKNDYSTGIVVKKTAGKRYQGGIDLNKPI